MPTFAFLLLLCLGAPALIALFAPRRWRLWIFALWVFAPLLIALALIASESGSDPASAAEADKLIYALLLIGSFLALPWLMACAAGYGIGAMLRRRKRAAGIEPPAFGASGAVAEPAAYTPPPVDFGGPTLSPPSGWQAARIGFDHDDLKLDGLLVWSLPWREEDTAPVTLAHPAHPAQLHEFTICNIDDGTRAARFAAAELSDGVWGFYRWVVPVDAASGTSADGSLRYGHDLGPFAEGRYDAVAPVARLHDTNTGAEVFDGSAWSSSRIVPQTDGTMLLALEHRDRQTIFLIVPAARTFRDLAAAGHPRPLADLAGASAAARADCDDPANMYIARRVAPDGSLVAELQAVEWSNTHWVRSPRLTEPATGQVLLDLWGTDWDAAVNFPRRLTVRLSSRRYHFGGSAEVEIDLASGRYSLPTPSGVKTGAISELCDALDKVSREGEPRRPVAARQRPTGRNQAIALLILMAALALIAIVTAITRIDRGVATKPELSKIPPMPATARSRGGGRPLGAGQSSLSAFGRDFPSTGST